MWTILVVLLALLTTPARSETTLADAVLKLPDASLTRASAIDLTATAVSIAAEADLDPYLLLAQAYVESRFEPAATSRLVDGRRRTGRWTSKRPPAGWSGNLYCGITQSKASTWRACLRLRDPAIALAAQAAELTTWLKRTRGNYTLALAGYGCGNAGLRHGCGTYPARIRKWARQLRRLSARQRDVPLS